MQFTWFSLFIFSKRPSRVELLTVIFILVGTVMAGNLVGVEALSFSIKGFFLALSALFTYAIYILANGRVGKDVRWQWKSTLIMVGSALTIFSINSETIITENHFGKEFLLWAIFLAVIGTSIPIALFAVGIPKIGAGVSSILMTIELPVAILCANIVLRERVTPVQITGIVIMLAAISAMNYYKSLKTHKNDEHRL